MVYALYESKLQCRSFIISSNTSGHNFSHWGLGYIWDLFHVLWCCELSIWLKPGKAILQLVIIYLTWWRFVQYLKHNPNGRFVVVCGDGEYIIYTAVAWRNRSFGSALEFVWSSEGEYAVRESTSKIKIFSKNFQVCIKHYNHNCFFSVLGCLQVNNIGLLH